MERRALFPGSFDPFTLGHKVVVDQALELFDRIVIAVGVNSEKRGLMTAENRVRLIRDLYKDNHRIEVRTYTELTGAFAGSWAYVLSCAGCVTTWISNTSVTSLR